MKKLLRKTTAVLVAAGLMFPAGTEMLGLDLGTAILASAAVIDSGTCGENLSWSLDDSGKLTISGSGDMVNRGSSPWFNYKDFIKSIEIKDGVTSIGSFAFHSFSSLSSITIPAGVNSIGEFAFCNCQGLSAINVDENNTKYSSVDGVLFNNDKTELILYPINKTGESYEIPNSVTKIIDSAFSGCRLKSVTIPNSVISIGDNAFEDSSLESVSIPNSVNNIGVSAFAGCENLISIDIPNSVQSIKGSTFEYCSSLKSVTIPDSVTSIGYNSFLSCSSLTSIFYPHSLNVTGASIDTKATQVKYTVSDGKVTITDISLGSGQTSVTIPETIDGKTVASIANDAVSSCTGLTSIFLPESLDVEGAGIPAAAAQVKYTVSDEEKVTITEITLGTERENVDIPDNIGDYPVVAVAASEQSKVGSHTDNFSNGFCTICGAYQPATLNDDVYEIGSAGQLYWFADKVNNENSTYGNANAVLTADITVNTGDVANCNGTKATGWIDWTPIGTNSNKYTGKFDGNNYTISGLYFNDSEREFVGLFGFVGGNGSVSNVGVVDSYFKGKSCVGGVCGSNWASDGASEITNCYNTGTVIGTGFEVGGVCGYNYGNQNRATITNCYNTGTVTVTGENAFVGGVCGYNNNNIKGTSEITNCYNTGTVTVTGKNARVGGVCGYIYSETSGTSEITNCYNTGTVTVNGENANVGSVCGYNYGGTITNCYFDSNLYSGNAVGNNSGTVGENVLGKTTDKFKSGEVCYLLNGSKSTNPVWYQLLETETYPNLDSTNSANRTVYQCAPCTGVYSNDENKSVQHTIAVETVDDVKKHKCTVCGEIHDIEFTADDTTDTISVCCDLGSVTLKAPENLTYDGTAKSAAVTGEIEGFDTPTIVYNTDDGSAPVNAGTYTASITYTYGENEYSVSVEYTIEKANITPTVEVTGSYSYTGSAITPTFTVKDGATALKPTDYTATFTDNINAGTATITIAKKSGGNYTFSDVTKDFTIGRTTAPTVEDTKVYCGASETGDKTVKLVLPAVGTIDYENSTVSISSNDNNVISNDVSISADGIKFTLGENGSNADKTATITATLVTQNYENITAKLVVTINEKETPAAPTCELGFTESNGTYTATITAVEGAEYSFDGTTWSSANTKENIAPNTVVTAYIRIKATTNTNESPVSTAIATTPALKAAKPTITASTTFTSSQMVTIGCTTEDSEIYYTIDGTAPTASTGIKYNAPFTVTATTTVKAIAIKSGFENSDVVTATYTKKTSSGPGASAGGSRGGSSGGAAAGEQGCQKGKAQKQR